MEPLEAICQFHYLKFVMECDLKGKTKKYAKLKTDVEKFSYMYDLVSKNPNLKISINSQPRPKSGKIALDNKILGNEEFKKHNYKKAIEHYNKAIIYAPIVRGKTFMSVLYIFLKQSRKDNYYSLFIILNKSIHNF